MNVFYIHAKHVISASAAIFNSFWWQFWHEFMNYRIKLKTLINIIHDLHTFNL